jgi:hypothetical protein
LLLSEAVPGVAVSVKPLAVMLNLNSCRRVARQANGPLKFVLAASVGELVVGIRA